MTLSSSRAARFQWGALVAILLLAALLRCWQLGHQSLWLDECFCLECSFGHDYGHLHVPRNTNIAPAVAYTDVSQAKPWRMIPVSLDRDLHPPLPYLLLRVSCAMFGYSEAGVRALSVIASISSIALLWAIASRLHGSTVAMWACLIMAVAQPQIEFAQEAKHYSLLTTAALAACFAMLRAKDANATMPRTILFAATCLAALFTHYYSVTVLTAIGLYILLDTRGAVRIRLTIAMVAAVAIFAFVWGPTVVRQIHHANHDMGYLNEGDSFHITTAVLRAAMIPARLLNEPPPADIWKYVAAAFGILICTAPLVLWKHRPDLRLWGLWAPAVIILPLVTDLHGRSWSLLLLRYSLLAGPSIYCVVAALGASLRREILRQALPFAITLSCMLSIPNAYVADKLDWRTFGHYIRTHISPSDAIVFASVARPVTWPPTYLLCASHYSGPMRGPVYVLDRPADDALLQELQHHSRVWLISDSDTPAPLLPGAKVVRARIFPEIGSVLEVTWSSR